MLARVSAGSSPALLQEKLHVGRLFRIVEEVPPLMSAYRVDLLHWPPADGYAVLVCSEEATGIVKERFRVWCESPPTASIGTARERRHGRYAELLLHVSTNATRFPGNA